MKKLLIALIIIIGFGLISAKKQKDKVFSIKMIENSLSKVGKNVSAKLYASKYETSNFLYLTFLNDLKNNNQIDKYNQAKIDTSKWEDGKNYRKPLREYYHKHSAFENFPVVNISYEGAILFCEWLSEKYNSAPKRKYQKVVFRLPTKKEWEKAAKGGLRGVSYPWGGPNLTNKQGCVSCNYYGLGANSIHFNKETKKYEVITDLYFSESNALTCSVDNYSPNGYGLYNMSGNVKEMIAQKGISKGGGYLSTGYDVRIQSEDTYNTAANDLGFRYFIEILEGKEH